MMIRHTRQRFCRGQHAQRLQRLQIHVALRNQRFHTASGKLYAILLAARLVTLRLAGCTQRQVAGRESVTKRC